MELRDRGSSLDETVPASGEAYELTLVRRTAERDRAAFEALYHAYHGRLARFLTRLTRQDDVAEEIINDTLWVVWQRAADFRGSSRVSTWIMGIAYRRALKTIRRASMQLVAVDLDEADAAVQTDSGSSVETADRRELVERALASLPLEQRLVVEFTYYLGHSCAEIAAIMDCPINTVKTRMFHARRKLRSALPELSGGTRT